MDPFFGSRGCIELKMESPKVDNKSSTTKAKFVFSTAIEKLTKVCCGVQSSNTLAKRFKIYQLLTNQSTSPLLPKYTRIRKAQISI